MNASLDENGVHTLLGTLNSDGRTTVRVLVNPSNHSLEVSDGTSGTDHGPVNAPRDENDFPAFMAVSSADGKTPVAVYTDASGNLLIQST